MAGGKGARFWPRSRAHRPKHLIDMRGGKTIIRETVDRILPLIPPERTLIVTAESQAKLIEEQLPDIPRDNIISEPVGRNTAPCIALASLVIEKREGDEVMVCLPADHIIEDEKEFLRILDTAAEAARMGDYLVTIGIEPTGPETGYGYLERGEIKFSHEGRDVFEVRSMREKPPREAAEEMIAQGTFYWNSGMFVWRTSVIRKALQEFLPSMTQEMDALSPVIDTPQMRDEILRLYPLLPFISIDYGVMEKAKNTLVIPGNFGWSDVGSWSALWDTMPKDAHGHATVGVVGTVSIAAENCFVHAPNKMVALVGISDLVIVETDDALLICRKEKSQEVKQVVDFLEAQGEDRFL